MQLSLIGQMNKSEARVPPSASVIDRFLRESSARKKYIPEQAELSFKMDIRNLKDCLSISATPEPMGVHLHCFLTCPTTEETEPVQPTS